MHHKRLKFSIKESLKIAGCIVLCLLAGIIGSLFTITGLGSWYMNLVKPSFNPPNWIFGPVWTILYILMGISLYLALKNGASRTAKILFASQLMLNLSWTMLFFGLKSPVLGLVCIIFLWLAILFTIKEFHKSSAMSAYLLVPYILWVSFASLLNYAIYILN